MPIEVHRKPAVLVTGFEPFGGSSLNPSQVIAESLNDGFDGDAALELHTALLPVDTRRVGPVLDALWQEIQPDVVLHFGESAKAEQVTLERVALNLLDFDTPDNAGAKVVDQPVDLSGPPARFASWPYRALQQRLKEEGIASRLSLSAGAYLCNQVLYLSLGYGERLGGRSVGFVHVPSLPEQVELGERSGPTMPREVLIDAAKRLVRLSTELYASH